MCIHVLVPPETLSWNRQRWHVASGQGCVYVVSKGRHACSIDNYVGEWGGCIAGPQHMVGLHAIRLQLRNDLVPNAVVTNLRHQGALQAQPGCRCERVCTVASTLGSATGPCLQQAFQSRKQALRHRGECHLQALGAEFCRQVLGHAATCKAMLQTLTCSSKATCVALVQSRTCAR